MLVFVKGLPSGRSGMALGAVHVTETDVLQYSAFLPHVGPISGPASDLHAIFWAVDTCKLGKGNCVVTNLQYAANVVNGAWRPTANPELVHLVADKLQSSGVTVRRQRTDTFSEQALHLAHGELAARWYECAGRTTVELKTIHPVKRVPGRDDNARQ